MAPAANLCIPALAERNDIRREVIEHPRRGVRPEGRPAREQARERAKSLQRPQEAHLPHGHVPHGREYDPRIGRDPDVVHLAGVEARQDFLEQ
jgi:hypothetical protein